MRTLLYYHNVTFLSFDIETLWLRKYKVLRLLWFRDMAYSHKSAVHFLQNVQPPEEKL